MHVPRLALSVAPACTVLSSSLTLALCRARVGQLPILGLCQVRSSFMCLWLSHGIGEYSPRNLLPSLVVQRHPTTARLGQRTLACKAEPKPSSQVNTRGS